MLKFTAIDSDLHPTHFPLGQARAALDVAGLPFHHPDVTALTVAAAELGDDATVLRALTAARITGSTVAVVTAVVTLLRADILAFKESL